MKKLLTTLGALAIFAIPTQTFAWTYDGLNSLNPFTGFRNCNPCKTQCNCKCKKQKLTKCEKLRGVKIIKQEGTPCGCAAPIVEPVQRCMHCQKAF